MNVQTQPFPVGMRLADRRLALDAERVREHLLSIDAFDNPLYDPDTTALCPLSVLALQPVRFPDWPGTPGRLAFNSGCRWEFHQSLRQDQEVQLTWRVVDRWLKRGKEYMTLEMQVHATDGSLIAHCRFNESVMAPPAYEPPLPNRDHEPGFPMQPADGPTWGRLIRTVTVPMAKAFADHEISWHTDVEEARKKGYDRVVLLGAHSFSLMLELLARVFGRGWFESGRIHINLLRPVFAEQRLTVHAVESARSVDDDGTPRLTLAVWCEDDAGLRAAAGTANARLVDGAPHRVDDAR